MKQQTETAPSHGEKLLTVVILLVAFSLRASAFSLWPENLRDDRDGYLALAQQLADGKGYAHAATDKPTAFRPPLYPLMLAVLVKTGGSTAIGVVQLLAGVATVWLTIRIGRKLKLGAGSYVAGALVAADPLLIQQTTLPMTETLCSLLSTLLIFALVSGNPERGAASFNRRRGLSIGILFGLCVLSRPTYWAFGVLAAFAWWIGSLFNRQTGTAQPASVPVETRDCAFQRKFPYWLIVGIAVTVAPWAVRNLIVFHRPMVTTTHGGYTLLLGNNPVFYQQEVEQPWGAVWEDAPPKHSQGAWYDQLQKEWRAELGDEAGEVEVDRWMKRRAYGHIRDEPMLFVKACALRFVRFWGILPLRPARESLPTIVGLMVAGFYTLLFVGFLCGLWSVARSAARGLWVPGLLLIASFTLVHLVYWSNIRMRAPVVPPIALVSAAGWCCLARTMGRSSYMARPSRNTG